MYKRLLSLILFISTIFYADAQGSGKMLDFNGSSQYVGCGTVNMSGTALTLQGWVKVDQFKSSSPYITSLWGTETPGTAQAMVRLGDAGLAKEKVQFVLYIGGSHYKLNGIKTLVTNRWYHIAATYDGSNMRIYIDGVLDNSMSRTGSVTSNSTFQIGQHYAASRTIDGSIDEVSVFRAALSQATIRQWMCQSIKSSHPNYSNLEGYWKLDKGSGSTITDHSGKSHTGTAVGSPTWATSPAPIGDTSIADYTSPFALNLSHPDGDSLVVSNISGGPLAAHVYRVDEKPNATSFPNGITVYDTTRYWGVHYVEGTNPSGDVEYHYTNNSHYKNNGSCMIDLASRDDNSKTNWAMVNATQGSSSLSKNAQSSKEYVLLYRSNKVIHNDTGKTICAGDSVLLEHSTTGMNYTWFRNSTAIAGATGNSIQAKQSGTYWLTANLGSCTDTSFTFQLTTQALPQVSLAPIGSSCPDVDFDTLSGGLPAGGQYQHTFVSGNLFVVKNAGPGNHKIVYTYTDQFGCTDTASQVKVVHPWPTVSLSPIPSMCADSAEFNLSNGTPSGGTYYINGMASSNFDASALGEGNHWIKYMITDVNGCQNADSTRVNIRKLPNTVLNLIKNHACEGDAIVGLNGQNPWGGTFSGPGVSGFNFDPKVAGPGKHPISYSYTDNNNGCSKTAVDTFTVGAIPAKPVITVSGDSLISTASDKYFWYDMNGRLVNDTNQVLKPTKSGMYYVIVRSEGCNSERSDTVNFQLQPNSIWTTSLLEKRVNIYPNPARDNLFIDLDGIDNAVVKVLSLSGQELTSIPVSGSIQFELNNYESGSYLIEVSTSEATIRKALLIQK